MIDGSRHLPLAGDRPVRAAERAEDGRPPPPAHDLDDCCITCGDVAVALTVVEVDGADARCRAEDGGEELVACDLVGRVAPGDRVLVHARVALERLDDDTNDTRRPGADDRSPHAFR